MSNGDDTQNNCIMEVCCGGDDGKQQRALVYRLHHGLPSLTDDEATAAADVLVRHHDFAPKGSLAAFNIRISPKTIASRLRKGVPNLITQKAKAIVEFVVSEFDLAPKGSLVVFKTEIARLARGHDYE